MTSAADAHRASAYTAGSFFGARPASLISAISSTVRVPSCSIHASSARVFAIVSFRSDA